MSAAAGALEGAETFAARMAPSERVVGTAPTAGPALAAADFFAPFLGLFLLVVVFAARCAWFVAPGAASAFAASENVTMSAAAAVALIPMRAMCSNIGARGPRAKARRIRTTCRGSRLIRWIDTRGQTERRIPTMGSSPTLVRLVAVASVGSLVGLLAVACGGKIAPSSDDLQIRHAGPVCRRRHERRRRRADASSEVRAGHRALCDGHTCDGGSDRGPRG